MLDAPTPSVAPNDDAPQRSFAVDVRGLPVSLRGFLEDLHVQSLLGDHLFQPSVLFLQGFEFLGHFRLHATILLPPAAIGLLGDLKLLAELKHLCALTKQHIRWTQLRNDLIYRMSFLTHLKKSFPGLRPDKILSLQLDQFQGRSVTLDANLNMMIDGSWESIQLRPGFRSHSMRVTFFFTITLSRTTKLFIVPRKDSFVTNGS